VSAARRLGGRRGAAVSRLAFLLLAGCAPGGVDAPRVPGLAELEAPVRELIGQALAGVDAAPRDAARWGRLGEALQAHGFLDEAIECYRRAEGLDPGAARWPHLRGIVHELRSEPEAAEQAFRTALERDPRDLVALCSLGALAERRNRSGEAQGLFLKALSLDPRCVAARIGLARLAQVSGALDAARRHLALALEASPRCGPAHAALGAIASREGRAAEARLHAGLGRRFAERVPLPDPLMDEILALGRSHAARLRQAHYAALRDDWPAAAEACREALRLQPGSIEARYRLGLALARAGEAEAGLRELEGAAASPERAAAARLAMARIERARGRREEAAAALDLAIAASPDDAEARLLRLEVSLDASSAPADALRSELEKLAARFPDEAVVHQALGEACLAAKRRGAPDAGAGGEGAERLRAEAARRAFERALELDASLDGARDGAGMACMQLAEICGAGAEASRYHEAAIAQFETLVRFWPERKSGHVHLIRALHTAGRGEEAIAAIRRAAGRWPEDPLFQRRTEGPRPEAPPASSPKE
jgi:tetratricopeptide (TPR) repeat protein